jgi:hypothetical protein
VVAGKDLEVAQRAVDADRAKVEAKRGSAEAAKSGLKSISDIEGYLEVRAPFDGVVTERNVHPGSLVGPATSAAASSLPMVRVEKISKLRLVVPVPEKYSAGRDKSGIQRPGVSESDFFRHGGAHRAFRRREDPDDAVGTGRSKLRRTLEVGNVSRSAVACEAV